MPSSTARCPEWTCRGRRVLLHGGHVVASGEPADVLTADRVTDVFGVRGAIVPHPITGRPHFVTAPA